MGTADPSRSEQEARGSPKASGPLPASAGRGPLPPLGPQSTAPGAAPFLRREKDVLPQLSAACGASTVPPLKARGPFCWQPTLPGGLPAFHCS